MRYTQKRNSVNVIPLLNAVCGIDMPYWRIDRHDSLRSYLSGDAADKLAAYEDAEEQGLLVRLPCKAGDTVYVIQSLTSNGKNLYIFEDKVKRIISEKSTDCHAIWTRIEFFAHPSVFEWNFDKVFLTREEAEEALKGGADNA